MKEKFYELSGNLRAMANLLYDLSRSDGIVLPTKKERIKINTKNVTKVEVKIYIKEHEEG